ncbi:MAG TPA: GatB/YqeY domain-containing protein [bacterium]|nr:GatB/YqeY domain-containing protein [bacterium]HPL95256.1 GatB/YqeY domain-containing protein [bacterium]
MLQEKINNDLKEAMRNKDQAKVSLLRMLLAAFYNEAITLMKKEQGLSDEEETKVLKREAKKRKDSIAQYRAGNRSDLVLQEEAELNLINAYLPAEMSEEELKKIVSEIIAGLNNPSPSQFGQIMKEVLSQTKGQADGKLVSQLVQSELNKT